ncbi:MAG: Hsp20/alpha crystallin family protein [Oxalobacter sp.]|nr:Hsp20/alpha crystallin family protein [Oxalobacter sp.]
MLDSLREAGKSIGRELNRAWESLSDGWRELLSRCSNALVHFERSGNGNDDQFPRWSLMNAEVEETPAELVVRLEMPGVGKESFSIRIVGNTLFIRGEKRWLRVSEGSTYHLVERAYGTFERTIVLPKNVDSEKSQASYVDGILSVRLPKAVSETVRNIPVE